MIGLIPVGEQSIADRYTYIPLVGIFIMIAWGVPELCKNLPRHRPILASLAIAWLLVLSLVTWRQLGYWRNSVILFGRTLQVTSQSHTAHTMMGNALGNSGDEAGALKQYQEALALKPDYSKATRGIAILHVKRGEALQKAGNFDSAAQEFKEALVVDPGFVAVRISLVQQYTDQANELANKGDLAAAIKYYQECLVIAPKFSGGHNNQGIAYAKSGDMDSTIGEFNQALAIDPDLLDARNNLGMALSRKGMK